MGEVDYERRKTDAELDKLRDEFHAVASTHVTWTTFWAIQLVCIGIVTSVVSFIISDKHKEHDELKQRLEKVEVKVTDNSVQFATLLVEVKQVQSQLSALQSDLKSHDRIDK